jgi:hypothetical protein
MQTKIGARSDSFETLMPPKTIALPPSKQAPSGHMNRQQSKELQQ